MECVGRYGCNVNACSYGEPKRRATARAQCPQGYELGQEIMQPLLQPHEAEQKHSGQVATVWARNQDLHFTRGDENCIKRFIYS